MHLLLSRYAWKHCTAYSGIAIVFHAFVGGKMMENVRVLRSKIDYRAVMWEKLSKTQNIIVLFFLWAKYHNMHA